MQANKMAQTKMAPHRHFLSKLLLHRNQHLLLVYECPFLQLLSRRMNKDSILLTKLQCRVRKPRRRFLRATIPGTFFWNSVHTARG